LTIDGQIYTEEGKGFTGIGNYMPTGLERFDASTGTRGIGWAPDGASFNGLDVFPVGFKSSLRVQVRTGGQSMAFNLFYERE